MFQSDQSHRFISGESGYPTPQSQVFLGQSAPLKVKGRTGGHMRKAKRLTGRPCWAGGPGQSVLKQGDPPTPAASSRPPPKTPRLSAPPAWGFPSCLNTCLSKQSYVFSWRFMKCAFHVCRYHNSICPFPGAGCAQKAFTSLGQQTCFENLPGAGDHAESETLTKSRVLPGWGRQ